MAGRDVTGQGKSGRRGHGKSWECMASQSRAGKGRTGQDRTGQGKAGPGRAGQCRAGQGRFRFRLYFFEHPRNVAFHAQRHTWVNIGGHKRENRHTSCTSVTIHLTQPTKTHMLKHTKTH